MSSAAASPFAFAISGGSPSLALASALAPPAEPAEPSFLPPLPRLRELLLEELRLRFFLERPLDDELLSELELLCFFLLFLPLVFRPRRPEELPLLPSEPCPSPGAFMDSRTARDPACGENVLRGGAVGADCFSSSAAV